MAARKDYIFKGHYSFGKLNIDAELPLFSFWEANSCIVYAPALDLSGYGTNEEEAKQSFNTVLDEFCRYTLNNGTIYKELERLGWKFTGGKKKLVLI